MLSSWHFQSHPTYDVNKVAVNCRANSPTKEEELESIQVLLERGLAKDSISGTLNLPYESAFYPTSYGLRPQVVKRKLRKRAIAVSSFVTLLNRLRVMAAKKQKFQLPIQLLPFK